MWYFFFDKPDAYLLQLNFVSSRLFFLGTKRPLQIKYFNSSTLHMSLRPLLQNLYYSLTFFLLFMAVNASFAHWRFLTGSNMLDWLQLSGESVVVSDSRTEFVRKILQEYKIYSGDEISSFHFLDRYLCFSLTDPFFPNSHLYLAYFLTSWMACHTISIDWPASSDLFGFVWVTFIVMNKSNKRNVCSFWYFCFQDRLCRVKFTSLADYLWLLR